MIPFDAEFAKRSADEFVDDVLVGALGATRVAIGENFRFGHKAQGDPRLLAPTSASRRPCTRCSRSTARSSPRATSAASCWRARWPRPTRLLGAPFQLCGEVVARRRARARARLPDRQPRARRGARLSRARRLRVPAPTAASPAAVSIGVRPTFETGRGELIEAYLLDFDGDLYGQHAVPRVPRAPARRAALRHGRGARRADAPRRRAHARARAARSRARAWRDRARGGRLLPCARP